MACHPGLSCSYETAWLISYLSYVIPRYQVWNLIVCSTIMHLTSSQHSWFNSLTLPKQPPLHYPYMASQSTSKPGLVCLGHAASDAGYFDNEGWWNIRSKGWSSFGQLADGHRGLLAGQLQLITCGHW